MPQKSYCFADIELKKDLIKARTAQDLNSVIRKSSISYLQERALRNVIDGTTSIDEMIKAFSAPKQR